MTLATTGYIDWAATAGRSIPKEFPGGTNPRAWNYYRRAAGDQLQRVMFHNSTMPISTSGALSMDMFHGTQRFPKFPAGVPSNAYPVYMKMGKVITTILGKTSSTMYYMAHRNDPKVLANLYANPKPTSTAQFPANAIVNRVSASHRVAQFRNRYTMAIAVTNSSMYHTMEISFSGGPSTIGDRNRASQYAAAFGAIQSFRTNETLSFDKGSTGNQVYLGSQSYLRSYKTTTFVTANTKPYDWLYARRAQWLAFYFWTAKPHSVHVSSGGGGTTTGVSHESDYTLTVQRSGSGFTVTAKYKGSGEGIHGVATVYVRITSISGPNPFGIKPGQVVSKSGNFVNGKWSVSWPLGKGATWAFWATWKREKGGVSTTKTYNGTPFG